MYPLQGTINPGWESLIVHVCRGPGKYDLPHLAISNCLSYNLQPHCVNSCYQSCTDKQVRLFLRPVQSVCLFMYPSALGELAVWLAECVITMRLLLSVCEYQGISWQCHALPSACLSIPEEIRLNSCV